MDTIIIKMFKFLIFTNTNDFFIIKPHLKGIFLNFGENISYKHTLEFRVEYYFASVNDISKFSQNFTHLFKVIHGRSIKCVSRGGVPMGEVDCGPEHPSNSL